MATSALESEAKILPAVYRKAFHPSVDDDDDSAAGEACYGTVANTILSTKTMNTRKKVGPNSGTTDTVLVFPVENSTNKSLSHCLISYRLPQVSVKKEYEGLCRLSWCDRVGHAMITNASFHMGLLGFTASIDSHYLNFQEQFLMSNEDKIGYHELVGGPEAWYTGELPAKDLRYPLPFFYSASPGASYPTYIENDLLYHDIQFANPSTVLRLQVSEQDDGQGYVDVPVSDYEKYLKELPTVEKNDVHLHYEYKVHDDTDMQSRICRGKSAPIRIPLFEVLGFDEINPTSASNSSVVTIEAQQAYIKAIMWAAVNRKEADTGAPCCYTTDGKPHITKCSIKYGTKELDKGTVEAWYFNTQSPRIGARSIPTNPAVYFFAADGSLRGGNPFDIGSGMAVVASSDISLTFSYDKVKNKGEEYTAICRALSIRLIEITHELDDEGKKRIDKISMV